jgi:5-methylcytosine-specific restriction endonuclease McrA
MPVPRPCIERLPDGRGCPRYADPANGTRCAECYTAAKKKRTLRPGTTAAWHRARRAALKQADYTCERCGKTDAESRAQGLGGLHVHHVNGAGTRAEHHDQAMLEVLCSACHKKTRQKATRPTLDEWKAEIAARAKARREQVG